jgi:hypothetical protein
MDLHEHEPPCLCSAPSPTREDEISSHDVFSPYFPLVDVFHALSPDRSVVLVLWQSRRRPMEDFEHAGLAAAQLTHNTEQLPAEGVVCIVTSNVQYSVSERISQTVEHLLLLNSMIKIERMLSGLLYIPNVERGYLNLRGL